jgi:hypothetical protein
MASKKAPSKSVAKRVEVQKKPVVHRKPKAVVPDVAVDWRDVEYEDRGDYERAKLEAEKENE